MTHTNQLMESAEPVVLARHLDNADAHSLYVLVISLCATGISFSVVWFLATSGLVAKDALAAA